MPISTDSGTGGRLLKRCSEALVWFAVRCALVLLAPAVSTAAAERIKQYDVEVEVLASGDLLITENITVHAQQRAIRKGIYRDFPTRYKDRWGNRVSVGFEVLEVLRDGRPEPWSTEERSNGVRVLTGGDDLLPGFPADYRYTLRYRTDHQLGFFDEHDELYWNAIGTGWDFAVEQATVKVTLPVPVPVAELSAEGYTGPQGAKGQDYRAALPAPGTARWELTRPLAPREGLTIVVTFPKGIIAEPSAVSKGWRWFADNLRTLVLLALFLPWVAYLALSWWRVGRDPKRGVIYPRYDIPRGMGPGALRMMSRNLRFDARCLTADLLAAAVAGFLRVDVEERRLRSDRWSLVRSADQPSPEDGSFSSRLLACLFPAGSGTVVLEKKAESQELLRKARGLDAAEHKSVLAGEYYSENGKKMLVALVGYVGLFAVAILLASGDRGEPAMIVLLVAGLALLVAFAMLIGAPTAAGRQLLDEIEGFKRYLSVAESDDIKRLQGPNAPPALDAGRFEQLLPYAVALEVAEAWTRKFTAAVGQDEADAFLAHRAWCRGAQSRSINDFTDSLSSSFSDSIASSSAPPGSSSGAGGGGSSGGGGGGGGGGGR